MRATVLPRTDMLSGWERMLPALPPPRRLVGQHLADWAVLGCGFAGMAAARRLAELFPRKRIALLDAGRVGGGASGRNSGFIVDLGHVEKHFSQQVHLRLLRLGRAGIDQLREVVARHQIQCDWNACGRLVGAVSRRGMRSLSHACRTLSQMGEPFEVLDGPAIASLTGMHCYRAAMFRPNDILVQPAALVRGLWQALPGNVIQWEQSPVHSIRPGSTIRLNCAEGSLQTGGLLILANAFARSFGLCKRQVFPMRTFVSVTCPTGRASGIAGRERWGIVSAERVGSSLRRLADGRLLIRNTARYGFGVSVGARELGRVARIHSAALASRFGRTIPLQHTWGGVMGMSANGTPFFGRVGPNILAYSGDNGHGIAMGTIAGRLLADLAAGHESNLLRDMQNLPRPRWVPPNPALGLGVAAVTRFLQWRAGTEL